MLDSQLTVWRGECPSCGQRVICHGTHSCPECGLVEPREVLGLARPEPPPWFYAPAGAQPWFWLVPIAIVAGAALATTGEAVALAVSLGLFLVASAGLTVAGLMRRGFQRRRARYQARLAQRHPAALAPQAAAIASVRASLEHQITALIAIRDKIDFAITRRDDDPAARRRLGTIRITVETAIAARRMTIGELDAATADIALARWLSRLAILTDEVADVEEVARRLADLEDLRRAAGDDIADLESIRDDARRGQLEERWAHARGALVEVKKLLRAEEERLLAVMVREAVRGVQPIATIGTLPAVELPASAELPTRGRAALELLRARLAGVRDEVQRCVDEDHRLRAEIEALVEVDRIVAH